MTLIAFGINHTTANLDVREKLAFTPEQVIQALKDCVHATQVHEIAILSTCNRMEIYCRSELDDDDLIAWLAELKGVAVNEVHKVYYCYRDAKAAEHMMLVASGLDSMVLGEPQIFGQMKSAYANANEVGVLGGSLQSTFERVFTVAKKVRSETAIGENPVSVAYAAVSLAQQIFSDLKNDTAMLIGAGETIELVAQHLQRQGIKRIIVANRTLARARTLADKLSGDAISLEQIPEYLHLADIVISSTASPLPLLGKGAVEQALKVRKHKPMFMVDIAVPRDIESQVSQLDDVFLYTVDDLEAVIDENKRSRQKAAEGAYEIIQLSVEAYQRDMRAVSSFDTIKAFRKSIDGLREQELQKSLKQLRKGVDAQDVLEQFARSLSNKFMHEPTSQVKKAGADGRQEVVQNMQTLFNLPTDTNADSD
ncbi:MAG: glutamyl-tRNA reductase [Alteromonadaceae bacterium]|nr:MAG: glutamyl-tRNA reductase [Alteromonadaceae bacterium]